MKAGGRKNEVFFASRQKALIARNIDTTDTRLILHRSAAVVYFVILCLFESSQVKPLIEHYHGNQPYQ